MHISKQRVYLLDWTSGSTCAVNLNLEWLTLYLVSGFLIITRSLFMLCCVHINCFHPLLFCLMLIVGIKLVMMCKTNLSWNASSVSVNLIILVVTTTCLIWILFLSVSATNTPLSCIPLQNLMMQRQDHFSVLNISSSLF